MRLREDVEPATGAKRRQLQCTRPGCALASALQHASRLQRRPAQRDGAQTNQASSQPTCSAFLNDGYHNAANSACRERLQPPNAVLLRLQSVQCSRGCTQQ